MNASKEYERLLRLMHVTTSDMVEDWSVEFVMPMLRLWNKMNKGEQDRMEALAAQMYWDKVNQARST